jgi:electron transfer flavoprotein beta subunit
MRVICLVKFVLDPQSILTKENNLTAVRNNSKLIINPDDACALAYALRLRKQKTIANITVVTMGPLVIESLLADLIKRGVDEGILISDHCYAGSDTLSTSKILAAYLSREKFDYIFTGTHSVDGDTSHVPSQVAQLLDLPQLSNIIDLKNQTKENVDVVVDAGDSVMEFVMRAPAIVSFNQRQQLRLPFVRYHDLDRDVSHLIKVIDNSTLAIPINDIGLHGSKTRVISVNQPVRANIQQKCFTTSYADLQQLFSELMKEGLIK